MAGAPPVVPATVHIRVFRRADIVADTKVSALTAVTSIDGADLVPVVQGGTSKKATFAQAVTFFGRSVRNASVGTQSTFNSDTYLTGSSVAVPASSLQAKSMYMCRFNVVKTAAGVATPIINLRFGTAGTTGDTSRGTHTFSAQTALADEGVFEVRATFRTVGSGTSAVIQSLAQLTHRLSITGLGVGVSEAEIATSGGFDSTVASSIIGLSVNGGASASWTVSLVQAELLNLL